MIDSEMDAMEKRFHSTLADFDLNTTKEDMKAELLQGLQPS